MNQKIRWTVRFATALMAMSATTAIAGDAGTIKLAKGAVSIERAGKRTPANVGDSVQSSDKLVTGADGTVGLTLRDNTRLSAGPNAVLSLDKFSFDSTTHAGELGATVKKGTVSVISGKLAAASPDTVTFRTPTATLGVRGTAFVIDVADRGDKE